MNRYVNGDGRKRIFQKPKSLGKYGMVVVTRLIEPLGLKLQLEKKQNCNTQARAHPAKEKGEKRFTTDVGGGGLPGPLVPATLLRKTRRAESSDCSRLEC